MLRIGVVNIDVSHPKAFSEYLFRGERARYVAVYNDGFRGDDEVEGFIRRYGLEKRCRTIEELADCVDIGFVQSCNWSKHVSQARPFIERGKPVFIDKPIAGSPAGFRALTAARSNWRTSPRTIRVTTETHSSARTPPRPRRYTSDLW